jgi:CTP synthase (UTP-ammonia lyase)
MLRIAILGDYNPAFESHAATTNAILLAAESGGCEVRVEWVPTPEITDARLDDFDGIWASPGSPYASFDGMLHGIRYARERGRPFVAT